MALRTTIPRVDWSRSINKGLVGWWPMWENAGGKALDIAGNNHGTLTNEPVWADGLKLDGTNDYVDVEASGKALNPGGAASWCMWLNPTAATATGTSLIMGDVAAASDSSSSYKWIGGYLTSSSTALASFVRVGGTSYVANNTSLSLIGKWTFYCGTFDRTLSSARLKTYVNAASGVTHNAADGDIDSGVVKHYIGAWPFNNTYIPGFIKNFRMFDRALTEQEIQQLYINPGAGLWIPDTKRYYVAAAGGSSIVPIVMRQYRARRAA